MEESHTHDQQHASPRITLALDRFHAQLMAPIIEARVREYDAILRGDATGALQAAQDREAWETAIYQGYLRAKAEAENQDDEAAPPDHR